MDFNIPKLIVHYNRSIPFQSLTSLNKCDLNSILPLLNEGNTWGLPRFHDPLYLSQRYQVEDELHRRFRELGGKPVLKNPIYFFLGRNDRFETSAQNIGYAISLNDIDPQTVSFSYGDSMFCFNLENRVQAGKMYQTNLCEQLYEVEHLHIEAQLWVKPRASTVKSLAKRN